MTVETLARPVGDKLGRNCGVTCVAVLAGVPFDAAWLACWQAIRKGGRRKIRGRWNGGTTNSERLEALTNLGVTMAEVRLPRRMRLETFVRLYARPGQAYMVRTGRHVQLVKDGRVLDQNVPEAVPVGEFWGRNKMVTLAHRKLPS